MRKLRKRKQPRKLYGILMQDENGFFIAGEGDLTEDLKTAKNWLDLRNQTCNEGEEFVIGLITIKPTP